MEAKQYAKMFGGFSTEKRVLIIKALIEAGAEGISLLDLSRITELSVMDIGFSAEALLMLDLIDINIKGNNKVLTANVDLLKSLFDETYREFGSARENSAHPQ